MPQLDALLRHIALYCEDPGGLATASPTGRAAVGGEDFAVEWFAQWHQQLVPHRPWQCAVITWRKMYDAPAEQLVKFMLHYTQLQQQQQQQQQQAHQHQQLATCAPSTAQNPQPQRPDSPPAAAAEAEAAAAPAAAGPAQGAVQGAQQANPPQQQQQQQHNRPARQPLPKPARFEGSFTLFPACTPLPSVLRKARKLQQRGTGAAALAALLLLCPRAGALLPGYAAKAGNTTLLRQMILRDSISKQNIFPSYYFRCSGFQYQIDNNRVALFAALKEGQPGPLPPLLCFATDSRYLMGLLVRFATRHSNAACLQEVMFHANAHMYVMVTAHHLALAAARTDLWAPAVVQLLLRVLQPRQLKAAYMRPAYAAACRTGNTGVLQLLLGVAAAAPRQQLPVLLEAAGSAGNAAVWQLLLQLDVAEGTEAAQQQQQQQAAGGGQQVMQQQSVAVAAYQEQLKHQQQHKLQHKPKLEQQQQQQGAPSQLPQLPWSSVALSPQQLVAALHAVLPKLQQKGRFPAEESRNPQQQQEDADRIVMAGQMWQQLVVQRGAAATAAVQQHLQDTEWKGLLQTFTWANSGPMVKLAPERAEWLLQQQLLQEGSTAFQGAVEAMRTGISAACKSGEQRLAARWLQQLAPCMDAAAAAAGVSRCRYDCERIFGLARRAADSIMEQRVRAACAAGDVAALQQLERLLAFMQLFDGMRGPLDFLGLQIPNSFFYNEPTLRFMNRVVNFSMLAEEMGLPWDLLERLVQQTSQPEAAFFISQSVEEAAEAAAASTAALHAARAAAALPAEDQASLIAAQGGAAAVLHAMIAHQQQYMDHLMRDAADDPVKMLQMQPALDRAALLQRHFQQRLDAGETVQPAAQQQLGPIPLWQQALIEVASHVNFCAAPSMKLSMVMAGLREPGGAGLPAVQRLLASPMLTITPAAAVARADWLKAVLKAAITTQQPELVSWSLQHPQKAQLWGTAGAGDVLQQLTDKQCNPISNKATRSWQQQQADRQQLEQQQQQLERSSGAAGSHQGAGPSSSSCTCCGSGSSSVCTQVLGQSATPVPRFAQRAAETALLLLQLPGVNEATLGSWIKHSIGLASSAPDLARAKAVLAAVAAAAEVPQGAGVMDRGVLRHVEASGDVDLLALLVLWGNRLELRPILWGNVAGDAAEDGQQIVDDGVDE